MSKKSHKHSIDKMRSTSHHQQTKPNASANTANVKHKQTEYSLKHKELKKIIAGDKGK